MDPTDIADITGATYTFLMNGQAPEPGWSALFRPGERVRLRVINGSSMTHFNVRIPGLPMTVVAADGQNVRPVETDEFQIAVAETYDVVVEPRADAYTIMAESMDRSGYAAGTLAVRPGLRARVPPLREPPLLTMADMGMAHSAAGAHDAATAAPAADGGAHAGHGADAGMQHNTAHHPAAVPVIARHGPDRHGPGNAGIAEVQRDRLGEPGTGLGDVPHRALTYRDLQRLDDDFDARAPARGLELHLTGHMERYMWSFDGVKFSAVEKPIIFHEGERLRVTLVNDTMMTHPIHLHGMFFDLVVDEGDHKPRKHTVNVKPGDKLSFDVSAEHVGDWAFHCHLLFHMHAGMMQVVSILPRDGAAAIAPDAMKMDYNATGHEGMDHGSKDMTDKSKKPVATPPPDHSNMNHGSKH
jgi:CopA family copper-resistance protein